MSVEGRSPVRSTLRQKRFRKFLFSEEELSTHADELRAAVEPVQRAGQQHRTSGVDGSNPSHTAQTAARLTKIFLAVFRPRDYRGGPHGVALTQNLAALPPTVAEFAQNSFRS